MKKSKSIFAGLLMLSFVFAVSLVSAAPVEKTDGFVCPVFNDKSAVGENNPNVIPIANGDYTIAGPEVSVPIKATNHNGEGSPAGEHASPNDADYTAIWA